LTLQFRRAARGRIGIETLQLRAAFGSVCGWAIHFERAALGRDGADRLAALVGHGLPRPDGAWRGSVRSCPERTKLARAGTRVLPAIERQSLAGHARSDRRKCQRQQ
jgi:hypothetical protein